MTLTEARLAMIADALSAGATTRRRLLDLIAILEPLAPFSADRVASLDHVRQMETDSLLLQFNNLVATVQDQLLRSVLAAEGRSISGGKRGEQREAGTALGALRHDIDFEAIIDARKRISHQYPHAPEKQAVILNKVWHAVPATIRAFEWMATWCERRYGAALLRS